MVRIYTFDSDDIYYGMSGIERFYQWQKENNFKREDFISVTMEGEKVIVAVWEE
jgi:hypothetical protein